MPHHRWDGVVPWELPYKQFAQLRTLPLVVPSWCIPETADCCRLAGCCSCEPSGGSWALLAPVGRPQFPRHAGSSYFGAFATGGDPAPAGLLSEVFPPLPLQPNLQRNIVGPSSSASGTEEPALPPKPGLIKASFFEPQIFEGVKMAVCPAEEIKSNLEHWESTILGYVLERRPLCTLSATSSINGGRRACSRFFLEIMVYFSLDLRMSMTARIF